MEQPQENAGSGNDIVTEKTFNKGPWTREEDDLLKAYVDQHGTGNWNAVHKTSNLSRDGKSCRLRWMNHLRPNLKKSRFTYEEEQRVIELQAAWGNQWAKMATELPGRTDNEIKNFWNTRLKRLQRQDDEVREKMMNAAAQSGLNTDSLDAHNNQDSSEEDKDKSKYASYYQPMVRNVTPTTGSFLTQRPYRFFQPNMYNSVAPPYISYPFTGGNSMNEQCLPLENFSTLAPVQDIQMRDNATCNSPSEPPMYSVEMFEPPLLQCCDSHHVKSPFLGHTELPPSTSTTTERQNFNFEADLGCFASTSSKERSEPFDGDWIKRLLGEDRPSKTNIFHEEPGALVETDPHDGLLESIVYGSSRKRRDSESQLVMSSLLGHPELPRSTSNTTGRNFNVEADLGYLPEMSELPSIQCCDSHQVPDDSYDEVLELTDPAGSSGKREATETDSESPTS